MSNIRLLTTVSLLAAWCLVWSGGALAADKAGHQLIQPYPGSTIQVSWTHKFDRVLLPVGEIGWDAKRQTDKAAKTIKVDGKLTYLDYSTPESRSGIEVFDNYRQGLESAGFKTLFSCYAKDCGEGYPLNHDQFGDDPSQVGHDQTGYVTAKLTRFSGDVYATLIVDQLNAVTDVVIAEVKPMQKWLVKVDASAMLNGIDRTGHAAIYGIYFDTDKAAVQPKSKQALGEIAKLLKRRPKLKRYVVGHTDDVGTLDYNMGLYRRRAAAVVKVLVQRYGIAAARLRPAGVGPLAPVLANTSDAGRAWNRRVELVAR